MNNRSLTKKRRIYNNKINHIKSYLQDYYQNKQFSLLNYNHNIATTYFPFLNKIYESYETDFLKNPQKYSNNITIKQIKCTIHIVHILESLLVKTKKRIKDIDKQLF